MEFKLQSNSSPNISGNESKVSSCWRILVKLKYINRNKQQYFTKILHHFILLSGVVCIVLFYLASSDKYHHSVNNDVNLLSDETQSSDNEPPVYKTISSWTLSGSNNNTNNVPILSSLRDKRWLKYSQHEIFSWKEVPIHFVNNVLKDLDSKVHNENNSSYGDFGKPVILPESLHKQSQSKMSLHQLNVVASDVMSFNRRLQDKRSSRYVICIKIKNMK